MTWQLAPRTDRKICFWCLVQVNIKVWQKAELLYIKIRVCFSQAFPGHLFRSNCNFLGAKASSESVCLTNLDRPTLLGDVLKDTLPRVRHYQRLPHAFGNSHWSSVWRYKKRIQKTQLFPNVLLTQREVTPPSGTFNPGYAGYPKRYFHTWVIYYHGYIVLKLSLHSEIVSLISVTPRRVINEGSHPIHQLMGWSDKYQTSLAGGCASSFTNLGQRFIQLQLGLSIKPKVHAAA